MSMRVSAPRCYSNATMCNPHSPSIPLSNLPISLITVSLNKPPFGYRHDLFTTTKPNNTRSSAPQTFHKRMGYHPVELITTISVRVLTSNASVNPSFNVFTSRWNTMRSSRHVNFRRPDKYHSKVATKCYQDGGHSPRPPASFGYSQNPRGKGEVKPRKASSHRKAAHTKYIHHWQDREQ